MLQGVVFIGTLKLKNPFGGLVVSVTTKPPSGLLSDPLMCVRISVVPRSVNDRAILLDGVNYVTVGISIQ